MGDKKYEVPEELRELSIKLYESVNVPKTLFPEVMVSCLPNDDSEYNFSTSKRMESLKVKRVKVKNNLRLQAASFIICVFVAFFAITLLNLDLFKSSDESSAENNSSTFQMETAMLESTDELIGNSAYIGENFVVKFIDIMESEDSPSKDIDETSKKTSEFLIYSSNGINYYINGIDPGTVLLYFPETSKSLTVVEALQQKEVSISELLKIGFDIRSKEQSEEQKNNTE